MQLFPKIRILETSIKAYRISGSASGSRVKAVFHSFIFFRSIFSAFCAMTPSLSMMYSLYQWRSQPENLGGQKV